ncbi:MAG TPA: AhpC/TSA family protein [Bacteroidetes bacterium]|nr:AhpC/TSA family protein [Bacteroidota bacterium]
MKKNIPYLVAAMIIALGFSCRPSERPVRLEASFQNAANDSFFISEVFTESVNRIDSLQAGHDGSFTWKTRISQPSFYLVERHPGEQIILIIHPGEHISISGNISDPMNSIVIEGSSDSERLLELNRALTRNLMELDSLFDAYQDPATGSFNRNYLDEINTRAQQIHEKQREYNIRFIEQDPGSLANLIALHQQISQQQPVLDLIEDYEIFARTDSILYHLYPENEPVQAMHRNVLAAGEYHQRNMLKDEVVGIGRIAPEIKLPSPQGDTIALSSTRGNIVLLDFWAGWCPPCRQENPNLVRIYNDYKNRGFRVYQVSIDRERETWLNAIEEDHLEEFIHVSDLKYWESPVLGKYYIESIPANFLLNEKGRIIARNLRGNALEEKLAEIFENR